MTGAPRPAAANGAGAVRTEASASPVRSVERLRLTAVSLALTLLMFAQSTGQVASDTKLDLIIDPARFLRHALSMWDPLSNAGELQNQAYGYLFPMGPFFVGGHWLHLAPWVVQRLWESALLVASFVGMFRLSRLLGIARFWPAVLAGLVYAITPRVLSELTSISAELTPTVALPWILAPLVRGSTSGSPRRSAARSGVALLFAGGTNAAAALAVLPVPAIWLLTRQRGPRRRSLMGYWVLSVVLATIWWSGPLVVLGRYSPPFLNWIEAAQNTTYPTSLSAVLRGVPHWESYLGSSIWPAAWIFVSSPITIVATSAVAALGLVGLARRDLPNRGFLLTTLVLGLVLVTFGHKAGVGAPFATQARTLLDGPLNAFRNIHKFEPLVTLPLAVGCGIAVERMRVPVWWTRRLGSSTMRLSPRALAIGCGLLLAAVAVAPAVSGRLVSQPRTQAMASWWPQAADWLHTHSGGLRTLVVPSAPKPTYIWGQTTDDAMEPVAGSPWIARGSAPLYQPGLARLLRSIDAAMGSGRSVPTLAPLLSRAGIGYVAIRNDLEAVISNATPQDVVRATLTQSPGFDLAAGFGPRLGGTTRSDDVVDGGAARPRPAIEIFRVTAGASRTALMSLDRAVRANGSTDSLSTLIADGLPAATPVFYGSDPRPTAMTTLRVATDGLRRQQASFGGTFSQSATMTADQAFAGRRAAYDFLPTKPGPLSTVRYLGIRGLSASSSGADVGARANSSPAHGPWSVFDGDADTAWTSGAANLAVGQWLQVELDDRISTPSIDVAFAAGLGPYPSSVRITTDQGSRIDGVRATSDGQTLTVPPGPTTFLRITVNAVQNGGFGKAVGISTLTIPGVHPQRTLDVPDVGSPQIMAFAAADGYRNGCLPVRAGVSCDPGLAANGEEDGSLDRSIRLDRPATYGLTAQVRVLGSDELNRRLDAGSPLTATASSVTSSDPSVRPGAAVDADSGTTWIAAAGDLRPTLTLRSASATTITGLRLRTAAGAAAAAPTRVAVVAGSQHWTGKVPASGHISFSAAIRTTSVSITVLAAGLRRSTSMTDGRPTLLPAGISTVSLDSAEPLPTPRVPATINFDCQAGLTAVIDGRSVPLSVTASTVDILAGVPVTAQSCDAIATPLAAGGHRLSLGATAWAMPCTLTLAQSGTALSQTMPSPGTQRVLAWGDTERRVAVTTKARSVLVVHENFNRGWHAELHGATLTPVQVDGWEQAFVVPAGESGTVTMTYEPQRPFEIGLLVGLVGALLVVLGAVLGRRASAESPLREGQLPRLVVIIGIAVAAGALAGVWGLISLVVVVGLLRLLWPDGHAPNGLLAAVAMMTGGLDIAIADPVQIFATATSDVVQLLTLGAVLIVLVGASSPLSGRRPREP